MMKRYSLRVSLLSLDSNSSLSAISVAVSVRRQLSAINPAVRLCCGVREAEKNTGVHLTDTRLI